MQLGLLISLCDGAGIASLLGSAKYLLKKPTTGGQKIRLPPILCQAIFLLGSMLAITYMAAVADAWLHASSKSVVIPFSSPYKSSVVPDFGRKINNTMCTLAQENDTTIADHVNSASCGLVNGGSGGSGMTLGEGLRVVTNTSSLHSVVFADDQTALVVPQSLPANISYSARTLGVKSECISVTQQCIKPRTLDDQLYYGSNAQLSLNCSAAGINYVDSTDQAGLCPLDSQGICTFGIDIESNPFNAGEVVTSMAYLNPGQPTSDAFIPNTGWFVHGNNGAWNVVFCNVTALDVTYRYESSRYIMESSAPQSLTAARYIMSAGLKDGTTTAISYAVNGAGLQPNTTYEGMYAMELSRQMLARAAHIYEPRAVEFIQAENTVIGSKLQLVPLILFICALVIFLLQVVYIACMTIVATRGMQYVGLAARHLNNPSATIQKLYGHSNPELSWEMDSEKAFGSETEGDRLHAGAVSLSNDGLPGSVFMIGKGGSLKHHNLR